MSSPSARKSALNGWLMNQLAEGQLDSDASNRYLLRVSRSLSPPSP